MLVCLIVSWLLALLALLACLAAFVAARLGLDVWDPWSFFKLLDTDGGDALPQLGLGFGSAACIPRVSVDEFGVIVVGKI